MFTDAKQKKKNTDGIENCGEPKKLRNKNSKRIIKRLLRVLIVDTSSIINPYSLR